MRRILYIPSVSQVSVVDNEGVQEIYDLCEALSRSGEKSFWYVLMPTWVYDGLRGVPNIYYLRFDQTRDSNVNDVVGFPAFELAQYFSRRGGKLTIDAAVTNCATFGGYLSRLLSDRFSRHQVPVYVRRKQDFQKRLGQYAQAEFEAMQVAESIVGHEVVGSPFVSRKIGEMIGGHGGPTSQLVFMRKVVVCPRVGLYRRATSMAREETRDTDEVFAFCGGGFDKHQLKYQREVLSLYASLFSSSGVRTVLATTSAKYRVASAARYKEGGQFAAILCGLSVDEYWREVGRNHFSISRCPEDLPDDIEEELARIAAGHIVVLPRTSLATHRLGVDYPFFYDYDKPEQALEIAVRIAVDTASASKLVSPFSSMLCEGMCGDSALLSWWSSMTGTIDAQYEKHKVRPLGGDKQSLYSVVHSIATGLGDSFYLDVFLDILEEHIPWLKPWGRKGTLQEIGRVHQALPTLYDLRMALDNLGWIDQCNEMSPLLKRERDPLPGVLDG